MRDSEKRSKLRKLGYSFTDEVWERLLEYTDLRDVECDAELEELERDIAVFSVERVLRDSGYNRKPRSEGAAHDPIQVSLPPGVEQQANAFSLALANIARDEECVVQFREQALQDRTLTPDEADAFVQSWALRYFSRSELESWGVPFVGHQAMIEEREGDVSAGELIVRLRIDPPGVIYEKRLPHPNAWNGPATLRRVAGEGGLAWRFSGARYIVNTGATNLPVESGSVAAELRDVAAFLCTRYPWTRWDAARFVLTRQAPPVDFIFGNVGKASIGGLAYPVIQVAAFPWVPAEVVTSVYRSYQREVRGDQSRTRLAGERAFAVYRFVEERDIMSDEDLGWGKLLEEWNRTCPAGWAYAAVSGFSKAYYRAERDLRLNDSNEGSADGGAP